MKKVLSIAFAAAFALSAVTAFAQTAPDFHMNTRFWHTDNGSQPEGRWSLHVVEFSAQAEVDNVGGMVLYRIGDEIGGGFNGTAQSYPVETKVWIKGGAHKLTLGLQPVPFGIYKWNSLYHPLIDIPGRMGQIWDHDWGYLYTYDAAPVKLDIGYFDNSGELYSSKEGAEKNTFTLRLGYDILPVWNLGISYLDGDSTQYDPTDGGSKWAIDTTWKIIPNLCMNAQYVSYKDMKSVANPLVDDGDYGALQFKYDVNKVPAPLNKMSFVLQYSWDNNDLDGLDKATQFQEELWLQLGKNLHLFWQNVQEKDFPGTTETNKYEYFSVKYNLF